jgi:hypothetical protein
VRPYIVVLCIASATSVVTLVLKGRLLIKKFCQRGSEMTDWMADVAHDSKRRQDWIDKLTSRDQVYNTMETQSIASGLALLDMFSAQVSSAAKSHAQFKLDARSNRLIGYHEGTVQGASPEEIVAHLTDIEGKFTQANQDRSVIVRFEVVQNVSDHHVVIFTEAKAAPFQNRTFLTSLICKKISDDPPTWVWVTASIPGHGRIRPEDERHAVRGEVMRCCRLTAVSAKDTTMQYGCWLDLKGSFPQWMTQNIAMPQQVCCALGTCVQGIGCCMVHAAMRCRCILLGRYNITFCEFTQRS